MLHELLLALVGYTGDIIIDEREQQKSLGIHSPVSDGPTFKLAPDVSFIEPSDRDLIERTVTLGFYYRELDRFASNSRNLSWIRPATANLNPLRADEGTMDRTSVYRRAIASGVAEILSVYRLAVPQIEQKLHSDTVPTLATVSKFFSLLRPLYELVLEIERDDIRGAQLLNLLHKRCHCGVPALQQCIQSLLWHAHQVMYNQLASWMVYGILRDPHGEFFIARKSRMQSMDGSSHPDVSENFACMSTDDTSLTDWQLGFHISLDMLPEDIHMHVAESVLFAGKAIRVLRNPSPAFQFTEPTDNQQLPRAVQKIQGLAGRFAFQKESVGTSLIGEELLPQSQADKIEAMLQDLKVPFLSLCFLREDLTSDAQQRLDLDLPAKLRNNVQKKVLVYQRKMLRYYDA